MKSIKVELERKEIREIIITLEIALKHLKEMGLKSRIEEIQKLVNKLWEQY